MARRPAIPTALRRKIEELDSHRCAYCRGPMVVGIPMVVEHIVPVVAGGASHVANLCLACYRCNEFKGSRQDALDTNTGRVERLFHPRAQDWREHFAWDEDNVTVLAVTPCGRATAALLRLNNAWLIQARRIWMLVGLQPPLD